MSKFNRIHALCTMLRQKPCQLCPSWEHIEGIGKCKQSCRILAQEAFNIVKHGNPWGPRHRPRGVKQWRARFNRMYAKEQ